jgi:membrane-associated phospholipid phosphatase
MTKDKGQKPLIRAIHTAVLGRARYKISGLRDSTALKKYLELRLSQEEIIARAAANHLTGNILVMFQPDVHPQAIAWLLEGIVLDYRKGVRKLPSSTAPEFSLGKSIVFQAPINQQLNQWRSQLIPVSVAFSSLAFATGLVHRYGLDSSILLTIQRLHTPLLDRIMVAITSLGQPPLLLLNCLAWEIALLQSHRRRQATTFGIAAIGAIGLNYWLKEIFVRTRPELWDRIIHVNHYSFPSGHAMVSMVVYGFMGYTLAQEFPQWRNQILAATGILILAIGFSRLYLGVHWPTDVVVGYATGLVWLTACTINESLLEEQRKSYRKNGSKAPSF